MQGRLLLGLPFEGKRYFDFSVNILTIGGECEALEWIVEEGLAKEELTQAESALVDLAYLCAQLEVHGIPKFILEPSYLLENLSTDDYLIINEAVSALRKKHIDAGDNPNDLAQPNP